MNEEIPGFQPLSPYFFLFRLVIVTIVDQILPRERVSNSPHSKRLKPLSIVSTAPLMNTQAYSMCCYFQTIAARYGEGVIPPDVLTASVASKYLSCTYQNSITSVKHYTKHRTAFKASVGHATTTTILQRRTGRHYDHSMHHRLICSLLNPTKLTVVQLKPH